MLTRGQQNSNNEMNKHWIIVGKITKRYDAMWSNQPPSLKALNRCYFAFSLNTFFSLYFAGCNSNRNVYISTRHVIFAYSHWPNRRRKREYLLSILNSHVVLIMLSTCILFPCYCASLSLCICMLCRFSQTKYYTLMPSAFKKNHRILHFHSIIRSSTLALAPFLRSRKKHTKNSKWIDDDEDNACMQRQCSHQNSINFEDSFFFRWSGCYCWCCCQQHQQCCCRNPYGIR